MTEAVNGKKLVVLALGLAVGALALAAARGTGPEAAQAASHREAPLIAFDSPADISDFFMFRSYEPGNADKVALIMNVNPGSEPSSGPNYWNFDPGVTYTFYVDNDGDGKADDVRLEFEFENEIRGTPEAANLFLGYVGGAGPLPPITALDGPGSEGLGLRQRYEVNMFRRGHRTRLASGLIAVPSNVGPRTMPDYEDLTEQGIYSPAPGVKVFAGQRQDPFYIDLGGTFDTFNFRRPVPALTEPEDENDSLNPFGTDMLSGFNVSTIAIEMPAMMLTGDTGASVIGAYSATLRPGTHIRGRRHGPDGLVQRLANPLVNETITALEDKDEWNTRKPEDERRFVDYYLNPSLALSLELVFGVPAEKTNRGDLVNLLLKYQPSDRRLSELLRLNLAVPPTPFPAQRRMGPLATTGGVPTPDPAAWPNGRRPKDDVTDIAVRVIGGMNYIVNRIGDGVNTDDAALSPSFPFLGTPSDGRNRQHDNP